MILLIYSSLNAQTTYKRCFNRDTLEILAKSNQQRLEYIEKYNVSLVEINNLNYELELFDLRNSNSNYTIDSLYTTNKQLVLNIEDNSKIINDKTNKIKRNRNISILLGIIIAILIWR